tara:strand:+ start:162 stop:356 length:195 start_codon:yes stop_codon:yes gene_type:complete
MASKQDLIDIGAGSYGETLKNREQKKMKGAIAGAIVGVALAVVSRKNLLVFGLAGLVAGRLLMD